MRGRVLQISIKKNSQWLTIAQATDHKFTANCQVSDVTTKDDGKVKEITGKSWSLSTSNLICDFAHNAESTDVKNGIHASTILKDYVNTGATFDVRLQYADVAIPDTDENENTGTGVTVTTILTGTARLTKMDLNFKNKENASYTAEFVGVGKPTIADPVSGGTQSTHDVTNPGITPAES